MDAEELYSRLKPIQEKKGYYFASDMKLVLGLLESLLTNKNRYGYMACPCRLASGEKDDDKDIICPCDYREPDVRDYGCCYCGLYVSEEVLKENIQCPYVPERRPPEKMYEW